MHLLSREPSKWFFDHVCRKRNILQLFSQAVKDFCRTAHAERASVRYMSILLWFISVVFLLFLITWFSIIFGWPKCNKNAPWWRKSLLLPCMGREHIEQMHKIHVYIFENNVFFLFIDLCIGETRATPRKL